MFYRSLEPVKSFFVFSIKAHPSIFSKLLAEPCQCVSRYNKIGSIRNFSPSYSVQTDYKSLDSKLINQWSPINCYPRSSHYTQKNLLHNGQSRYFVASKNSTDEKKEEIPPEKLSLFKRFKAMYRDYWYVLVPVHVITSAVWFGCFYYMAKTGVDIGAFAEMIHLNDEIVEKIRKSGNSMAGHLAISYLLYKVATPARYTVTLGGTTVSINYLKKWGWIKPIPKREELKKMFDDKKVQLKKKRESFKESREVMKRNLMNKLSQKKRIKKTEEMVRKMLLRRRAAKKL